MLLAVVCTSKAWSPRLKHSRTVSAYKLLKGAAGGTARALLNYARKWARGTATAANFPLRSRSSSALHTARLIVSHYATASNAAVSSRV